MMIVLAVDPGKASGIAVLSWDREDSLPTILMSVEADPITYADHVEKALEDHGSEAQFYVACESFTINAQTVRNSQAPWSLENIGILKHLCYRAGYAPENISFQPPVNAKNMFPNPALKQLGTWHKGGEGHANDAIRHGLLRLVKIGWTPRALLE